jgi:hypothetical protein
LNDGVAVQLITLGKPNDTNRKTPCVKVARYDRTITTVIARATEDGDFRQRLPT